MPGSYIRNHLSIWPIGMTKVLKLTPSPILMNFTDALLYQYTFLVLPCCINMPFWCCPLVSICPSGVVLLYQYALLVLPCCINTPFWCCHVVSICPSGVVLLYQYALLVLSCCINMPFWCCPVVSICPSGVALLYNCTSNSVVVLY